MLLVYLLCCIGNTLLVPHKAGGHNRGVFLFVEHPQRQKSHPRQLVQIVSGFPENVYCWRLGREEGIESKRPFVFKVDGLNLAKYLTQGISNTIKKDNFAASLNDPYALHFSYDVAKRSVYLACTNR